ncbi:ABC transporter permease [Kitasatospora sp. GP82]|uniref:ABC transporter permease n=1 Tax=Kitasatospora sp. GP82 TaxID=3035089 RepID=UPI002472F3D0|nr:ABC transporter permease [Kitasatospora sp. GP82]MDH6124708.1 teichoic acid transport system permease protein [Kitasatospora sp. GP82]
MSTVSDFSLSTPSGADAGLTPKQLAAKYGLAVSGKRPSLPTYVRQLWARRHFILAFATARLVAQYTTAKLGQVWQVLTPLLNCSVFFLVFGVMMKSRDSVPVYLAWLCVGVFVFQFSQSAVQSGTRSIADNLGLIRALHFPRACMPVAFTVIQLQQLLISMVVLVGIVLANGQMPHMTWLLIIPALLLQCLFNTGLALIMARVGSKASDISQLMPFILRTWMYVSGVMYSIQSAIASWPPLAKTIMALNPATIYMDLMRYAFMPDSFNKHIYHGGKDAAGHALAQHLTLPHHVWLTAGVWAVVAFAVGFVFFWKAEEEYGRG